MTITKYDLAMDAIREVFGDTSVSVDETRDNLSSLVSEIEILLDTLDGTLENVNE